MNIRHEILKRFIHMERRCYGKDLKRYKDYAGKNIKICDDWLNDPTSFIEWSLKNGFKPELSIDRIDVEKGYSPDNCRWTTSFIQAQNTRRIHSTNKSGYRGVSWQPKYKKWQTTIRAFNKTTIIGYYTDIIEAAKAYDTFVIEHSLAHTTNGLILSDSDKVSGNTGKLLIQTNTSGYNGVHYNKHLEKWVGKIQSGKKCLYAGYGKTSLESAIKREVFILKNNMENRKIKRNFPNKTLEDLSKWKV